jgi:hypothetical protein
LSVYYCVYRCFSFSRNQKDKKINNGRHNITQTNRQYNGQETKRQKDKQRTTQ